MYYYKKMTHLWTDRKYDASTPNKELFDKIRATKECILENKYDECKGKYLVHHIDGDKRDNRESNLACICARHHNILHSLVQPFPEIE
jgi:hypothetical protein